MESGPGRQLRRKRRKIGVRKAELALGSQDDAPTPLLPAVAQVDYPDFLCLSSLIIERNIPIIFPGSVRPKDAYGMVGAGGSFIVYTDSRTVNDAIQPREIQSLTDKVVLKRSRASPISYHENLTTEAVRYSSILAELQILTHPAIVDHQNFIQFLGLTWDFEPNLNGGLSVWPVLGLEEALFPMSLLHTKLNHSSPGSAIKFCHDIAKALDFLHSCGVAHCDIKSENVLICWDDHFGHTAKLSDFGSVLFNVNSETTLLHGIVGTKPWNAPEYNRRIDGLNVFKTDVFSFGMLVWRSIQRTGILVDVINAPEKEQSSLIRKIDAIKSTSELVDLAIADARYRFRELCDFENMSSLLQKALIYEPTKRATMPEIKTILENLNHGEDTDNEIFEGTKEHSFESEATRSEHSQFSGNDSEASDWIEPVPNVPFYNNEFDIIYAKFEDDAALVKEELLRSLIRWATRENEHEFDTGEAAYQLSTCHFNGFGVKRDSERGLHWLLKSARLGSQKARAQAWRVYGAVFQPAFQDRLDRSEAIAWLDETVKMGSQQAAQDLQKLDLERYEDSSSRWLRRFCTVADFKGLSELPSNEELLKYCQNLTSAGNFNETTLNSRGNHLFHLSCSLGYLTVARKLVECGADINILNNQGETPLLCACRAGQSFAALWLLREGADTRPSSLGESPLHWLIALKDEDIKGIAIELTSRGASLEHQVIATESNEYTFDIYPHGTPLDWAVSRRNEEAVQALVELGADPFNDCSGYSPIVRAVSLHDYKLVKVLLQSRHATVKRVNEFDKEGQSLLFQAIYCNRPFELLLAHNSQSLDAARRTILLLLDFGCDPSCIDEDHSSVLHLAAGFCDLEFLQLLMNDFGMAKFINVPRGPRKICPIHQAIASSRLDVLKYLISQGADTLCRLSNGFTILHLCSSAGDEEGSIVSLKELGIHERPDLDERVAVREDSNLALSAFEMALKSGNFKLSKLLLDSGASSLGHPTEEHSLLLLLVESPMWYSSQAIKFYLDNCPYDFIVRSKDQVSALHAAASITSLGHFGDVLTSEAKLDTLLSQFSEPQHLEARTCGTMNKDIPGGQTPLHYAAKFGVYFATWRLLQAGADPHAVDDMGNSPLDLACRAQADLNTRELEDEMPHLYVEIESVVNTLKRAMNKDELLPRRSTSFVEHNTLQFSRLGFHTKN